MAVNKAEQTLDDQLVNRIKALEDELILLKTYPQKIGADIIDVKNGGLSTATSPSVASTNSINANFFIGPTSDFVATLFNFECTAYVDTYDAAHKYPDGSSLTNAQRNMRFEAWFDYIDTNDFGTFVRAFKVRIVNLDASAHVYYIDFRALFPKFTAA